jgi:hypothetical protein
LKKEIAFNARLRRTGEVEGAEEVLVARAILCGGDGAGAAAVAGFVVWKGEKCLVGIVIGMEEEEFMSRGEKGGCI